MLGIPPCAADGSYVLLCDILLKLKMIVDVVMSRDEGHLMAAKHRDKVGGIDDPGPCLNASQHRRVLSHIEIRTHRHILEQALDEAEDMVGITFLVFAFCVVDDVIESDDHIVAYPESIVFRAHLGSVGSCSVEVA